MTTDPSIVTLEHDHPNVDIDAYWTTEARKKAAALEAGIPARYTHSTPTNPTVTEWVQAVIRAAIAGQPHAGQLIAVTTGPSLLLLGPTGTGKTHQAYGALRALGASGVTATWKLTTAADLYARMRPRHGIDSETVFSEYATAPVLAIDDLGAAKGSEWTEEINYRLINHRYDRMLPTLLTSNVGIGELRDALGDRVTSRLVEMTDRAVLDGPDRRRAGA